MFTTKLLFTWFVIIVGAICYARQRDLYQVTIQRGSYGYNCTEKCSKKNLSYYWCYAKHPTDTKYNLDYWDYCSPEEGLDYRGRKCREGHACGTHGYSYKWCYTDTGSWGYCGYNVTVPHRRNRDEDDLGRPWSGDA